MQLGGFEVDSTTMDAFSVIHDRLARLGDIEREALFAELRLNWCFACGARQGEGYCQCENDD